MDTEAKKVAKLKDMLKDAARIEYLMYKVFGPFKSEGRKNDDRS